MNTVHFLANMLGILWFTVWATVGEALYDENTWFTEDGEINNMAFDWQRNVRSNFSDTLRTFAQAYHAEREGDEELTMQKVKSRLRMVKIFKYSGNDYDFGEFHRKIPPLPDGGKYCTTGQHIKVDCNYCSCVAGQLYMCTGMVCSEQTGRPQSSSTCTEGTKRKIDSCNYCYCRNGREFCSTKDCGLDHGYSLLRRHICQEGERKRIKCNRCVCHNGEEYCTRNICEESQEVPKDEMHTNHHNKPHHHDKSSIDRPWLAARCVKGSKRRLDSCNQCYCYNGEWFCEKKVCGKQDSEPLDAALGDIEFDSKCKVGSKKSLDSHRCTCYRDGWRCVQTKPCRVLSSPTDRLLRSGFKSRFHCIVGSVGRIDACNRCWCGRKRQWQCTNFECLPLIFDKSASKNEKPCDKYDIKYTKCGNRCECIAHHWLCTQKPCQKDKPNKNEPAKKKGDKHMYGETCQPGEHRKLDACNDCYCRYGKWLCQTNDCEENDNTEPSDPYENPIIKEPKVPDESENPVEELPIPNTDIFNDDFDTNKYTDNIGPVPNEEPDNIEDNPDVLPPPTTKATKKLVKVMCKPGSLKKLTCQDCRCGRDFKWNCKRQNTRKCLLFFKNGGTRGLRSKPECEVGGRLQIDTCNYCLCSYDHKWLCSNRTCTNLFDERIRQGYEFSEPLDTDSSDEVDDIDDVGLFGTDGLRNGYDFAELSLRYKSPNRVDIAEIPGLGPQLRASEDRCIEGNLLEVDSCNHCICYNGIQVCTRKLCWDEAPPRSYFAEPECLPGKPVPPPDECNVCICLNSEILCSSNTCGLKASGKKTEALHVPKCVSGMKRRIDSCNFCFCRKGVWFCENKECGLTEMLSLNIEHQFPESIKAGYEPGSERNYTCRRCTCRNDRRWLCTKDRGEKCRGWRSSSVLLRTDEMICVDGTQRDIDACNYCICHKGVEFCTRRPCRNNEPMPPYNLEPECLPGALVPSPDNCNHCICLDGEILCTENQCSLRAGPYIISKSCKRGSSKKYECYRCACYDDGWKCRLRNKKKCRIDPITGKPFLRQQCKPGTSYKVDPCKECVCSSSGTLVCSRVCSTPYNQQRTTKPDCVEGHKYRLDDGCNYCVCQGGQEFCTARACLTPVKDSTVDKNDEVCSEGEITSAQDGCNQCVCIQGKLTCTNRDCSKMEQSEEDDDKKFLLRERKPRQFEFRKRIPNQVCIPGETYLEESGDPDCPNSCICNLNELLCTKRRCRKHDYFIEPISRIQEIPKQLRLLKRELCDDLSCYNPCMFCTCTDTLRFCIPCSKAEEIDSHELIKGNTVKKKMLLTFCQPFTFFSPVGNRFCRNCFCLHNGLSLCLLNLCKYSKDIPHHNTPQRNCDQSEFHMGFQTFCAGCKCSVNEWYCSIESETCQDYNYSNVTCPKGTFIQNPNQHCSICLCGGEEEGSSNMCFTDVKCARHVAVA